MCTGKEGNSWRQGLALGSKSASALAVAQQVTRREADNPQPQFLHLQDGSGNAAIPLHLFIPKDPLSPTDTNVHPEHSCGLLAPTPRSPTVHSLCDSLAHLSHPSPVNKHYLPVGQIACSGSQEHALLCAVGQAKGSLVMGTRAGSLSAFICHLSWPREGRALSVVCPVHGHSPTPTKHSPSMDGCEVM